MNFGTVSKDEADILNEIINENISGFVRVLDVSGIKHAKKEHPNLTDSDFLPIPLIVEEYDYVGIGKKEDIIVYKKLIGQEYFYVEQIQKRRKKLAIEIFYKRKKRPN